MTRGAGEGRSVNRRRLAELFRLQAETCAEIAAALLEDEPANDPAPRPRKRGPARVVAPVGEVSEIDRERARRELDRLGYRRRS
jgi:hypothetical protein